LKKEIGEFELSIKAKPGDLMQKEFEKNM